MGSALFALSSIILSKKITSQFKCFKANQNTLKHLMTILFLTENNGIQHGRT